MGINFRYHPIEALTKIEIEHNKKAKAPLLLTMHFDLDLQNKILGNIIFETIDS